MKTPTYVKGISDRYFKYDVLSTYKHFTLKSRSTVKSHFFITFDRIFTNCVFTSGKKMSQQQCMPVFIQMKLDPVWIQHLQIKLTKFVNFYWMLCLNKKNVTSYQLFHATLKGTIHILRRHLHSTQLYLTSQFFTKTGGFHQNKRIYFSSLHLHFDNLVML